MRPFFVPGTSTHLNKVLSRAALNAGSCAAAYRLSHGSSEEPGAASVMAAAKSRVPPQKWTAAQRRAVSAMAAVAAHLMMSGLQLTGGW